MGDTYSSRFVAHSTPGQLANLTRISGQAVEAWSPEELRDMIDHQMAVPLEYDLAAATEKEAEITDLKAAFEGAALGGIRLFGDLFRAAQPDGLLLDACRRFFKPRAVVSGRRGGGKRPGVCLLPTQHSRGSSSDRQTHFRNDGPANCRRN